MSKKSAKRNAALIGAAVAAAVASGAWANSYEFHVARIIDPDTYEGAITVFPGITVTTSVRVNGIDTPEKFRPKCDKEKEMAERASGIVERVFQQASRILVTRPFPGKYAGRTVATVLVENPDGERRDIGEILIDAKLAVPFDGGTKTKDWCAGPGS